MKTIFFAAAIMFANLSVAQISVNTNPDAITVPIGKVKSIGTTIAELYYLVNGRDSVCVLLFWNKKFKSPTIDYQTVKFRNDNGTLATLYTLFKSVFIDENWDNKTYHVNFSLGKEQVMISARRNTVGRTAEFRTDAGYFYVSENQVDKLFGRKN